LIEIVWAEKNSRMRKVVKRSNYRVTGKYPSWKMNRMIQWESTLERDFFYLLDADPTVIAFHEQPACIYYDWCGERRKHYPDVLVEYADHKVLLEVKPKNKIDEHMFERTRYLKSEIDEPQLVYDMITEEDIRQDPLLPNAKLLLRYGRLPVSKKEELKFMSEYFKLANFPSAAGQSH